MLIRTLLADRGEIALLGLRAILSPVPRIRIVGEARGPEEMMAAIAAHEPQVVVIDHTAEGFGVPVVRDALRRYPRLRFVALTPPPSQSALKNALKAGVQSYVKKDCDKQEIIDSVLHTGDGQHFFCGKILRSLEQASVDVGSLFGHALNCTAVTISEREAQVLKLIAEGYSYTGIAEMLCLSAHTVTTHRKNIMHKLGVNNTAALVIYAVKSGLISPNKFVFNA